MGENNQPDSFRALGIHGFGGTDLDVRRARLLVRNNLFSRYSIEDGEYRYLFDRYVNAESVGEGLKLDSLLMSSGFRSQVIQHDFLFCFHQYAVAQNSVFEDLSNEISAGGALPLDHIERLARFIRECAETSKNHDDISKEWSSLETVHTVYSDVLGRAQLPAGCHNPIEATMARVLPFCSTRSEHIGQLVMPKMSLADIFHDRRHKLVGLPTLERTSLAAEIGLIVSNLCEISWHFHNSLENMSKVLEAASVGSGVEADTVLAMVVYALLEHGYLNVCIYGGDPVNLHGVCELAAHVATSGMSVNECQ